MALHTIVCRVCSEPFEAVRSDAESCSHACRMRLYRERRHARHAAEIERAAALLANLRAASANLPED